MDIESTLEQSRGEINRELERILSRSDSLLFQAMRYAVLSGGKRFRPLLLLSAGACFGAEKAHLMPFACALELIHNYSLIHDDLPAMDNDDFRRGKPACHKAFGEDVALLAGDGLLTLAFEIMAGAPEHESVSGCREMAIREISEKAGAEGMIEGQFMDITLSQGAMTEEIFHKLILKKTGALIVAAVRAGAILGKASPPEFESVSAYGQNIGLAFQVRDDIQDFGDEKKGRKSSRPNYVALLGLQKAEIRLKQFVRAAIEALDATALKAPELRYLAWKLPDRRW